MAPKRAKIDKLKSETPLMMIKGGGKTGTSGPTESIRTFPKGKALRTDFAPNTGKRSKTRLYVGGV